MNWPAEFQKLIDGDAPVLALAPMQDVTDLAFWRLMAAYGGADIYFTEYFRVHEVSHLEKWILESITKNPTGRPVVAQMIGNHVPSLVRAAKELQQYPIAAVDLNLGCPAPIVYKKCAGGGLLREPQRIDGILGALRDAVSVKFTVKTRLGFDSPEVFEELLPIFAKHSLDLLTVHGRTVREAYHAEVHYDYIARAVAAMPCPVLANGNIYSASRGHDVLAQTGAGGLMIGRGAIRNPWIFQQCRQLWRAARNGSSRGDEAQIDASKRSEPPHVGCHDNLGVGMFVPTGRDVLAYIHALYDAVCSPDVRESAQVQKMKKYLNFVGLGVEPTGQFLHRIRRTKTKLEFFAVCKDFLDHDQPMPLEPFSLELKPTDIMAGEHC